MDVIWFLWMFLFIFCSKRGPLREMASPFDPKKFQRPKKSQGVSFETPPEGDLLNGSEVLQSLLGGGNQPLSEQFLRWKIWKQWNLVVGPTMAGASEPVGYRKGILVLWVKSSAWVQQMSFFKDQIISKVNLFVGFNYVQDIQLTLNRRSVPDAKDAAETKKALEKI